MDAINVKNLTKQYGDFETLLQMFGIADKKKTYVKELSGGERQRLFIVFLKTMHKIFS